MADALNIDFCELIVLGTGLTESIIAGAFQRIDKLTLHLDRNNFYGDQWSSHTLNGIESWVEDQLGAPKEATEITETPVYQIDDGIFLPLQYFTPFSNVEREWHVEDDVEPDPEGRKLFKWTKTTLLAENRRFNLELTPKIIYSCGEMVELLISSGVSRYLEFKSVSKILSYIVEEDRVAPVPCSRADVFSTNDVSVVEKRILMKLMESCQDEKALDAESIEFSGKTFVDYLNFKRLTPRLVHYVTNAIAQTNETTTYQEGVAKVQKFLKSLGRFGNSPYLWTQYGTGEIPQAFCRLCAVFGGVYYLNRDIQGLVLDKQGSCKGVISNGKRIDSKQVVLANGYGVASGNHSRSNGVSRAIFITDRSLYNEKDDHIVVLTIGGSEFKIFETGYEAGSAPKDLRIVHIFGPQTLTAKEDIQQLALKFLRFTDDDTSKPRVFWSLYFNTSQIEFEGTLPENVFRINGPSQEIDIDDALAQAKQIYSSIFPDVEFLPKAPEPEDIILDGDDNPAAANKTETGVSETVVNEVDQSTPSET